MSLLVLCPNAWDREALARPEIRDGHEIRVAGDDLVAGVTPFRALTFDVERWIDRTAARHQRRVDGVIGTGDYPGCMFAAAVAERLGLPSAGARAVVLLSHKLYSREIQQRLVPEATPAFEALDPFADRDPERLGYPFFLKPVKGTMSIRAQLVGDEAERRRALAFSLRERIEKSLLLRPFQQLLRIHSDGRVPAHFFIAEAPLRGDQVTVEGFVQNGAVTVMGIVDSVFYPGTGSFRRFDYPSRLPAAVQARMVALVERLIAGSGLDDSCFNVELFHDEGAIHVIEVNPRMSYQFADLFERVDGTHSYDLQIQLALGRPASFTRGAGRSRAAASFVLRRFEDARVRAVPSPRDVETVRALCPDAIVNIMVKPGERLSRLDQDVGSFRYAIVNLGAPSVDDLHARWSEVDRLLPFHFERV
jgi:hypothetical protein